MVMIIRYRLQTDVSESKTDAANYQVLTYCNYPQKTPTFASLKMSLQVFRVVCKKQEFVA